MKRTLPEGHTVKYSHERGTRLIDPHKLDGGTEVIAERGGATHAIVYDEEGLIVAAGEAVCRADSYKRGELVLGDAFDRKLGRQISLGRALKALETGVETKHSWRTGGGPVEVV